MTAEEINNLKPRVRDYIHELETNCDPSGLIRENIALKENVVALESELKKYRRTLLQMRLKYIGKIIDQTKD